MLNGCVACVKVSEQAVGLLKMGLCTLDQDPPSLLLDLLVRAWRGHEDISGSIEHIGDYRVMCDWKLQ